MIASFDIGIKNLAYCKLGYQPNEIAGNQFKITDWNVLDLVSDDAKAEKTCQMTYKSGAKVGQICGHKAYYTAKGQSLCKTHSKGFKEDEIKRLFTCANISLFELAKLAVPQLDKIDFNDCRVVIIESQPSKNPKMKNFSMMLFNYFVIRYIAEKPVDQQKLKEVRFINAKNKLKVYDGPYVECKLKSQYSRNKFYGKVYCPYMIRNNPLWLNFFKTFKKKDDLADSFLMGCWFLMNAHSTTSFVASTKPLTKLKRNYLDDDPEETDINSDEDETNEDDLNCGGEDDLNGGGEDENEDPKKTVPTQKIKLKVKLKLKSPQLVGRQKLQAIQKSQTTQQIRYDYNMNKYRQLKKGYKPKDNATKYTLSNLKYFVKPKMTLDQIKRLSQSSSLFNRSALFYFGSLEAFHKVLT